MRDFHIMIAPPGSRGLGLGIGFAGELGLERLAPRANSNQGRPRGQWHHVEASIAGLNDQRSFGEIHDRPRGNASPDVLDAIRDALGVTAKHPESHGPVTAGLEVELDFTALEDVAVGERASRVEDDFVQTSSIAAPHWQEWELSCSPMT